MQWINAAWLIAMTAGMAVWLRNDARQYRVFRTLEDSAARLRFYRRWTVQSFVVLCGASLVSLWLVGGLGAPFAFPVAFRELAARLNPGHPAATSSDGMAGLAIGLGLGLLAVGVAQYRRSTKRAPVLGDIEPLLPRNARERMAAVPLSLNAGFSEELFFRCALPLLLTSVTGSAAAAFAIATVAFVLAHAYQGWKGVLGTKVAGALLGVVYLSSGSLLRVMTIHALIDIVALVVRPVLTGWIAARRPADLTPR